MKVDKKGRVSLPAELRAELPDSDARLMLFQPADTPWINGCAYGEFDRVLAELEQALPGPARSGPQRLASNILGIGADDDIGDAYAESVLVQLDPEGRFSLPDMVRQTLKIGEAVMFVGKGAVFQIWHPDAYAAHRADARARRLQRFDSGAAA
jgi:MraZ protein